MKAVFALLVVLVVLNCQNNAVERMDASASITETGEVDAFPDMGYLDVEISCTRKTIQESKNCAVNTDVKVLEVLKSFKISDSLIHTGQINRDRVYEWIKNSNVFVGYSTTKNMNIEVSSIETLQNVVDELLSIKEVQIYNTSYGHSKYDSLKTESYVKAINKLKERAKVISKELGYTKIKVVSISDKPIELPNTLSMSGEMILGERRGHVSKNLSAYSLMEPELNMQPGRLKIASVASMLVKFE